MSINLEKTVKDWIDTDPDGDGLTAYLEVPADRPKRLVTIERVGGNENEYSSHPTIAVGVGVDPVLDRFFEVDAHCCFTALSSVLCFALSNAAATLPLVVARATAPWSVAWATAWS